MDSFMKSIHRIARCGQLYRAEHLEKAGLNGGQHMYILYACREPGISQEQLSQKILVNKSSVCRQLANLEQSGFIYRESDENDRRVLRVYPTEKGKEVFPEVCRVMADWRDYLMQELTPEERQILEILLGKLVVRAEEYAASRLTGGQKEAEPK